MPTPATDEIDLHAIADRVEQLLEQLQSAADTRLWLQIEELVRALTDLYGAGLTRTVELADQWAKRAGSHPAEDGDLLGQLAGDELVASLMLLHGAHPQSLEARAERAVAAGEPEVAARGGSLRLVGVEPESGVVHVSVTVSGSGCGSDPGAVGAIARDILLAALPDATTIEVSMDVDQTPVETPVRLSGKRAPAGAGR
jgi:Fe-S cluster biogenesis protein NfuA